MLHVADIKAVKVALDKANAQFGNSLLPNDSVNLGFDFNSYAAKKTIKSNELNIVKTRCIAFLKTLCQELIDRLPENLSIINNIRYFSPNICMDPMSRIKVNQLPWELAAQDADRELISIQWHQLSTLRLQDISLDFDEKVDVTHFWITVSKLENASGNKRFKDLAAFALRALSLPISNAVVERIFSIMAVIKTKLRNRMLLPMLSALIRIRVHLYVIEKCCKDYIPSQHMLDLFTNQMYATTIKKVDDTSDIEFIEAMEMIQIAEEDNYE